MGAEPITHCEKVRSLKKRETRFHFLELLEEIKQRQKSTTVSINYKFLGRAKTIHFELYIKWIFLVRNIGNIPTTNCCKS